MAELRATLGTDELERFLADRAPITAPPALADAIVLGAASLPQVRRGWSLPGFGGLAGARPALVPVAALVAIGLLLALLALASIGRPRPVVADEAWVRTSIGGPGSFATVIGAGGDSVLAARSPNGAASEDTVWREMVRRAGPARSRNWPSTGSAASTHWRASGTPDVRPRDDERAVASSSTGPGTRTRACSLASAARPGHLRADGVRGHGDPDRLMRSTVSGPRHASTRSDVTFWRRGRSSGRGDRPSGRPAVRRQRLPTKPSDPPQLAATAQRFVRTHRPSVAPGSVGRGSRCARFASATAPAAP